MNERFDPDYGQVVPMRGLPNALAARLGGSAPGSHAERVAPHNIDAEQALLGAILINNAAFAKVSEFLKPEHFMEEVHRRIFETTVSLIGAGKLVSPITLKTYLGDADLGGVTVMAYLARLAAEATTVVNAAEYGRTVYELAMRRRLIGIGDSLLNVAYEAPVEANPLVQVETVESALFALKETIIGAGGGLRRARSFSLAEAGDDLMSTICEGLRGEGRDPPSTGITALDEEIAGGLLPSTMITIGARPAMGKTAVGIELARSLTRTGWAGIYHSLEIPAAQVTARLAASRLLDLSNPIPFSQIMKRRALTSVQAEAVAGALHDMRNFPLTIEDGGARTIQDIANASDRLANLYARRGIPLGAVVIDHAHIVKFSRHFNNEVDGIKEVADGALALAKHLDTCVILLAQLNRDTEKREDKRPSLADLRGGGAIEQNSDAVIFLYRPAYYIEKSAAFRNSDPAAEAEFHTCRNLLEMITDKNRLGRSNHVIRAWINLAQNAVRNLQHGH